jgi:hypothetical protein
MLYAVTIEPLNTMFFVSERPDDNDWEVQEGVSLDAAPLYGTWTPDREPFEQILCASTSDPKYYKLFRNRRDIDTDQFRPTGRHYGGLFSKPTWERFAREAPPALAILEIPDEEPYEPSEAVAAHERGA